MLVFILLELLLFIWVLFTWNILPIILFLLVFGLEILNWSKITYHYNTYWYKKIFRGYIATTFGQHIVTYKYSLSFNIKKHEEVHCQQYKKWSVFGFLIIYLFNFLFNLLKYWNFEKAYKNIYFEKEANGL